ncbi:MAG: hypothetical protein LBL19_05660, partial [Spirochaetaceae bacterium]|nr:hypothetical protein [Spirochaetaceae bacterium]
ILFYRLAVKKIGAESPVRRLRRMRPKEEDKNYSTFAGAMEPVLCKEKKYGIMDGGRQNPGFEG